ncbi:MAG: peptidylprolyl isomerase [Clostridia bacterium]|nr:peptidylprolyl isomerase [Clostridia bacterium]
MMKNPIATITMNSGKRIVLELLPDYAYNEVCSFISAAQKGYFDHFAIQRIVPGSWIDVSYNAFFREECQYFLPNELKEKKEIKIPELGDICLGYYSADEVSGTEFFFPLRRAEELRDTCPVFGKVIEGVDELIRISEVETYPNPSFDAFVKINHPKYPEVIVKVEVDTFGETYPEPRKLTPKKRPSVWPAFA